MSIESVDIVFEKYFYSTDVSTKKMTLVFTPVDKQKYLGKLNGFTVVVPTKPYTHLLSIAIAMGYEPKSYLKGLAKSRDVYYFINASVGQKFKTFADIDKQIISIKDIEIIRNVQKREHKKVKDSINQYQNDILKFTEPPKSPRDNLYYFLNNCRKCEFDYYLFSYVVHCSDIVRWKDVFDLSEERFILLRTWLSEFLKKPEAKHLPSYWRHLEFQINNRLSNDVLKTGLVDFLNRCVKH